MKKSIMAVILISAIGMLAYGGTVLAKNTYYIDDLKNWSYEKPLSQQAISVLKINIGKEDKLRLTKALHQMNITSETMYPGLDGLAKSVGRLREGLGDY